MKKLLSVILLAVVLLGLSSVLPLKSGATTIACQKPEGQIGTCARLVHKQSLVGLNDSYAIELTPTNSTSFEGAARKKLIPLSKECGKDYVQGVRVETGLTIQTNTNATGCDVPSSAIGQW